MLTEKVDVGACLGLAWKKVGVVARVVYELNIFPEGRLAE
jgi:hypothetical protein